MNIPSINFIGAGRFGKTLAKLIAQQSVGVIQGVCNRTKESTKATIDFIGHGTLCETITDLPSADITFITTSDDKIQSCCDALSRSKQLRTGSVIVHCSGVLNANILQSAKKAGCLIASVHPMKSFADPSVSVLDYPGTYCAMEGDDDAIIILAPLFQAIGSINYRINADKKALYHVGGVFASNYLVTIFQQALACLQESGVSNEVGHNVIIDLMQSTLNNLKKKKSATSALTGPIKRGDSATIQKHLDALPDSMLYRVLGLAAVDVANLTEETKTNIKSILVPRSLVLTFSGKHSAYKRT